MSHKVSSAVCNLLELPGDALYNGVLDLLSARGLYSFSQVSKKGYEGVKAVARLSQSKTALKATVTFIKGEKDEADGEPITDSFTTTLADLFKTIEALAKRHRIIINEKNVSVTLTEEKGSIPFAKQDQTVSKLIFHRFMMETLWEHAICLDALLQTAIAAMNLPTNGSFGKQSHPKDEFLQKYPLLVLFDFETKQYSGDDLGVALESITKHLSKPFPEHAANFAKLLFRHPRAKQIPRLSLAEALQNTLGEGSMSQTTFAVKSLAAIDGFKGEGCLADHSEVVHYTVAPKQMLESGKTKNLTIPKLIFSHQAAYSFRFNQGYSVQRYDLGSLLLCAVRYRSLDLVKSLLALSDAKEIKEEDLHTALNDANAGGEPAIVNEIQTFIERRKEWSCTIS